LIIPGKSGSSSFQRRASRYTNPAVREGWLIKFVIIMQIEGNGSLPSFVVLSLTAVAQAA
jgi:hypothetical protein